MSGLLCACVAPPAGLRSFLLLRVLLLCLSPVETGSNNLWKPTKHDCICRLSYPAVFRAEPKTTVDVVVDDDDGIVIVIVPALVFVAAPAIVVVGPVVVVVGGGGGAVAGAVAAAAVVVALAVVVADVVVAPVSVAVSVAVVAADSFWLCMLLSVCLFVCLSC